MGTTRGFWDPEDGTVRRFDELFDCGEDRPNSRSETILRAMRVYMEIHEQFAEAGFVPKDSMHERQVVRYAVMDSFSDAEADG